MGGNVALNFGLTYPEMARSLVVAGTGSGSTDVEPFRRNVNMRADRMRAGGMEAMGDYLNSGTRVQLLRKDPVGYEEFRQGFLEHSPIGSALTFSGGAGAEAADLRPGGSDEGDGGSDADNDGG